MFVEVFTKVSHKADVDTLLVVNLALESMGLGVKPYALNLYVKTLHLQPQECAATRVAPVAFVGVAPFHCKLLLFRVPPRCRNGGITGNRDPPTAVRIHLLQTPLLSTLTPSTSTEMHPFRPASHPCAPEPTARPAGNAAPAG